VPTARRSRTIAAPVEQLWDLVCDPHHLPRWWPRVTRVEDVDGGAFTEVMQTKKGKWVRADYDIVGVDEAGHVLTWAQRIDGTPFARLLSSAETELRLAPAGTAGAAGSRGGGDDARTVPSRTLYNDGDTADATEVTIELRQSLAGYSPRFGILAGFSPRMGGYMVRRAAEATLEQALDGLERISG
jgi:uncharacterized protein YndB with AHSA1/START domain